MRSCCASSPAGAPPWSTPRACSSSPCVYCPALRAMGSFADRLERKLAEIAARSSERAGLVKRLQTIDGVGTLTSIRCATLFTRVPLHGSDAAVAFFGLDPRPHDSGQHRGRRRLSKRGPSEDRRLLYNAAMSAMSAIRTPTWRPLYQHLRNR